MFLVRCLSELYFSPNPRYSHVMHIVSQVSGQLRTSECTPFDAFRAIFPAGTVSGAPKIKAMELISSLEKDKRGIYAGMYTHTHTHTHRTTHARAHANTSHCPYNSTPTHSLKHTHSHTRTRACIVSIYVYFLLM